MKVAVTIVLFKNPGRSGALVSYQSATLSRKLLLHRFLQVFSTLSYRYASIIQDYPIYHHQEHSVTTMPDLRTDSNQDRKGIKQVHSLDVALPALQKASPIQSIRSFWTSVKQATSLKRRSLPEIISRVPSIPSPCSESKRPRQSDDTREGAFGEALIGLMKRNSRSRKLLCESTLREFEREDRSSPRRRSD